jgi:hypothetical protein
MRAANYAFPSLFSEFGFHFLCSEFVFSLIYDSPGRFLRILHYLPYLVHGTGEYFGRNPLVSWRYCRGGSRMIVFAVLIDQSGITLDHSHMVVVHRVEHQLPLCSVAFRVKQTGPLQAKYLRYMPGPASSRALLFPSMPAYPQPPTRPTTAADATAFVHLSNFSPCPGMGLSLVEVIKSSALVSANSPALVSVKSPASVTAKSQALVSVEIPASALAESPDLASAASPSMVSAKP